MDNLEIVVSGYFWRSRMVDPLSVRSALRTGLRSYYGLG